MQENRSAISTPKSANMTVLPKSVIDCVDPMSVNPVSPLPALHPVPTGQWECDACQIRNDLKAACCVACQSANPHLAEPVLGYVFTLRVGLTFILSLNCCQEHSAVEPTKITNAALNSRGEGYWRYCCPGYYFAEEFVARRSWLRRRSVRQQIYRTRLQSILSQFALQTFRNCESVCRFRLQQIYHF